MTFISACARCDHEFEVDGALLKGRFEFKPERCPRCDVPLERGTLLMELDDALIEADNATKGGIQ